MVQTSRRRRITLRPARPARLVRPWAAVTIAVALTIAACSGASDDGGTAVAGPSASATDQTAGATGTAADSDDTSSLSAAPGGPAQVLAAYVDAYNDDDLDRVMTLFSEESRIIDHPFSGEANGPAVIRILHTQDRASAADDDPYEVSDVEVHGDTVTWNHVWTNGDGQDWCAEGHEAVIEDGTIIEWTFAPNPRPCP